MPRKSRVHGKVMKLASEYERAGIRPDIATIAERVGRSYSSVRHLIKTHRPDALLKKRKHKKVDERWKGIDSIYLTVYQAILESLGTNSATRIAQETGIPLRNVSRWLNEGLLSERRLGELLKHCGFYLAAMPNNEGRDSHKELRQQIKHLELENIQLKNKLGITFTDEDEYTAPHLVQRKE